MKQKRSSSSASRSRSGGRSPRRGAASRKPAAISFGAPIEVKIDRLGGQGDGIAEWQGDPLFVPRALPGETIIAAPGPIRRDGRSARLDAILTPSADRVEPPCPQFGTCGGCVVQHLARPAELDWKRQQVAEALSHRGLTPEDAPVAPIQAVPAATRRRATFSYKRLHNRLLVGFNEKASHQIVPLTTCLVLTPALSELLASLPDALSPCVKPGAEGDIAVVATDTGIDLTLDLDALPDLPVYEALADMAESLDLARLSVRVNDQLEPLLTRRQPVITLADTRLPLPSGAFLQPSEEGQALLQRLVMDGLAPVSGPVADLFCGVGTFALAAARQGHSVTAYDHLALQTTPLHSTGRVTAVARDLFRQPLLREELFPFNGLILDPPRAGARQQCEALALLPAGQGPQRVVMVSCNPATFARDARILCDGGFALRQVTPVDQFVWSAHLELVAIFDRLI